MTLLPTVRRQLQQAAERQASQPEGLPFAGLRAGLAASRRPIRLAARSITLAVSAIVALSVVVVALVLLGHVRPRPAVNSPVAGLAGHYHLDGNGIGRIRFGETPVAVAAGLRRLLGRPTSATANGRHAGLVRSICGFNGEIDWTGLAATSTVAHSVGLTVYFKRSRFVGYSYGPPYGDSTTPVRQGPVLSTPQGLSLGDTVAGGRRRYGQAFSVTEQPQGTPPDPRLAPLPAWTAHTASGRIYGFREGLGQARSSSAPILASISAGATPNTPCRSVTSARSLIGRRQRATVRLSPGQVTRTFEVQAVAAHPYDITVDAPASAALSVRVNTPNGNRSVLDTIHDPACRARRGQVGCLLHFAAGGTPGGKWTVVITKTSTPAAAVVVSVVFIR